MINDAQSPLELSFNEVDGSVSESGTPVAYILPDWSSSRTVLTIPNCILRGALFSATRGSGKKLLRRVPIKTLSGITIVYTGARLTQADLDVWHGVLALSKMQFDPDLIDFSAKAFLKMIHRSDGKSDREWLKNTVAKMCATTLEITQGDVTYGGSLIDEFYREESTGRYKMKLNRKLANLFAPASWTAIDWNQRSALQGKPLALWLHAFYSSHRAPFDYKTETLMELSGSEFEDIHMFRRRLKQALGELTSTIKWTCSLSKGTDTVSVSKTAIQATLQSDPQLQTVD